MLEYSILSANDYDEDATLDTTPALQTKPYAKKHVPSDVQYLGLSVHCSESSTVAKSDLLLKLHLRIGSDVNTDMCVENDVVKELTKELDETMTLIEDKIDELAEVGDEMQEQNGDRCNTRYRMKKEPTEPTETGCRDDICVEKDCTKIENLLESSFQITERIMRKTYSISFGSRDSSFNTTKTHYKGERILTSNKVDFALNKRTKKPIEWNRPRIQTEPKKRHNDQTLSKHIWSSDDTIVEEVQSTNRKDNDGAICRYGSRQIDSPISCCFQESENTFVPDLQVHPLEFLFKERRESSKTQAKKRNGILRFLNCKRKPGTPKQRRKFSDKDYTSKALTAFIERRRSLPKEEHDTARTPYTRTYQLSTAADKMTSSDVSQDPGQRKEYSKHKLLQTIRFKKGLISVASLRNSLTSVRRPFT